MYRFWGKSNVGPVGEVETEIFAAPLADVNTTLWLCVNGWF